MAVAPIDGSTADNIIVGSGPGVPSEVKVYQVPVASTSSAAPLLFSTFKPYGEDRSGVTVAAGFVGFFDRPRKHHHRSLRGQSGRGQGVRFPAARAHGQGGSGKHANGWDQRALKHRLIRSVRRGLSRLRFTDDGVASRGTWWCQAHCRQPACGQRFGKGLFERLGPGRGSVTLPAQSPAPRPRRPFPRKSPPLRRSMELAARGSPRPARRRAPISSSVVSPPAVRTQAYSNTSSSGRTLSRRHCGNNN